MGLQKVKEIADQTSELAEIDDWEQDSASLVIAQSEKVATPSRRGAQTS
jgi:hypothetical protein